MVKTRTRALCFSLALAGASCLVAATPAAAVDATKEQATAAFHAGLAAGSKDVKMVRMHLHHTINCLVGPAGAGYDEHEMNPCKDLGTGALADSPPGASRVQLETALARALAGLKTDDLAASQKLAAETQGLLK